MTQDDIIRMAREAGGYPAAATDRALLLFSESHLERFATLVAEEVRGQTIESEKRGWLHAIEKMVAAEREACARVCEEECADPDDQFKNYEDTHTDGWQDGCNSCAWAIRARGESNAS